jgi:large subunit ribosomal protein L1
MPKKKESQNPIEEEKISAEQAEVMSSESEEASQDVQTLDENAEQALVAEEGADADQAVPAEVAAISEQTETAEALNKKSSKKTKKEDKPAAKKSRRSAKFLKTKEKVEAGKLYKMDEAIELVKELSMSKYDGAVEAHVHMNKKKAKGSTESSKGTFHLPHGSGKEKKITILTEDKIEEIAKTKKIDFDIAIATPALMPKVAKIAKILGPKGKMPDPKSGTVTDKPEEAIKEINSGKVEYRIDAGDNIHQMIGRVSWDSAKLLENLNAIFASLPKARIAGAYLVPSVGPSVPLDLTLLK